LSIQEQPVTTARVQPVRTTSWLKVIVQLFKLRIVTLLLFASLGGAFIGAGGAPTINQVLVLLLTGGLGSAGASALNQYIERNSDGKMKRTSNRPLVNGTIRNPELVLWVALAMILVPVSILWFSNAPMAFFILLGAIIYVLVYTVWLKPRTILNIVIGGAAGSCAVLTGGAAVNNWQDSGVLLLASIVFLWTPAHFWALAIMVRDDYINADVPMLPARTNPRDTAIWGLLHAFGVGAIALLLGFHPALGWLYILPTLWMTWKLLKDGVRLVQHPDKAHAKTMFLSSNLYLAVLLFSICLATVIGI
jgi:protoheme IX farnesyltransferase